MSLPSAYLYLQAIQHEHLWGEGVYNTRVVHKLNNEGFKPRLSVIRNSEFLTTTRMEQDDQYGHEGLVYSFDFLFAQILGSPSRKRKKHVTNEMPTRHHVSPRDTYAPPTVRIHLVNSRPPLHILVLEKYLKC
jgi:hypothetical protein